MMVNARAGLAAALLLTAGCRTGEPEVYVGFSVHLEGWDLSREQVLLDYLQEIDALAALFEERGARLNLEGGTVVLKAAELGDPTLGELARRGHAVTVHLDLAQGTDREGYRQMVDTLVRFREALEDLGVDPSHTSGVCSEVDWVSAVSEAGFDAVAGATLWCARALDPALQPPELAGCEAPSECHWPWPEAPEQRLHPWAMGGGADWIHPDPDGPVVMIPTGTGLDCNEEVLADPNAVDCALGDGDLALWLEHLDAAVAESRASGELTVLRGTWSMGDVQPHGALERWLEALEPYLDDGRAGWATVPQLAGRYRADQE